MESSSTSQGSKELKTSASSSSSSVGGSSGSSSSSSSSSNKDSGEYCCWTCGHLMTTEMDKSLGMMHHHHHHHNNNNDERVWQPRNKTAMAGIELLWHPHYNKGLGFTWNERKDLNLHGLLPSAYRELEAQSRQVMANVKRMTEDLDKYMYLMGILDRNEKLFYHTLIENLTTLMPIVYTPTVGLACQKFGEIVLNPRGMWITIKDHGRIYQMLKHWPEDNVKAICLTDGERILGLGDLGAYGMGIPIGKLALYTGCGGIPPQQLLPVMLDVGTDQDELRESEFYIGIREKRARGKAYDNLIEEFMLAVTRRWGPTTLIQFEDFGNSNAFRLLERFQKRFCTFNDDIQGTAAVVLAGIYAALKIKDAKIKKLSSHTFLMYGAGSAGIGIANLIVSAIMQETGESLEEARKHIWLVDSTGLIYKDRKSGRMDDLKQLYAHSWDKGDLKELDQIVEAVQATAILGVCGTPDTFTKAGCQAVKKYNNRPIIFPMSNPTDKSECTAEQAYQWTENKCIFASGSPFPKLTVNDEKIVPAQCNNAYIFPGVALGVIASKSSHVTEEMFLASAKCLANLVSEEMAEKGIVYPPLEKIHDISFEIAVAVAKEAYEQGHAMQMQPKDLRELIASVRYKHKSYSNFQAGCFDSLNKDFGQDEVSGFVKE